MKKSLTANVGSVKFEKAHKVDGLSQKFKNTA
jgi:hypothetical protein